MEKKERIVTTDNHGILRSEGRIFKARVHQGVTITYEELDEEAYDKRVSELAERIAAMPGVDLMSVLRDALYDVSLRRLDIIEKDLNKEEMIIMDLLKARQCIWARPSTQNNLNYS